MAELDAALAQADAAFAESDDAGRRFLNTFVYVHAEALPSDPYSESYRDAQMRLYAHVSGRATYEARINEHSHFDLEAAKLRPFPYMTRSAETVGTQLVWQGLIIQHLSLPPGSRLVEFGAGWGNLTLHLAQMGHVVTAVEIEPAFGALIHDRASRLGVDVHVVEQDMLEFEPDEQYDGAIFFESLHHCADHVRMLRRLDRIVAGSGVVLFGSEPLGDYPHPWGLRLDGLSVWSMRRFGWLELGFDTSYFLRTLLRLGWSPQRHRLGDADVIVARRSQGLYEPHRLALPPDEERTWSHVGPDYRLAASRSVMSCARDVLPAAVEFCVSNHGALPVTVALHAGDIERTIDLVAGARRECIKVPVAQWSGQVAIGARPPSAGAGERTVAVHHVRCVAAL
jgi:SAM-dependent methyltransferase